MSGFRALARKELLRFSRVSMQTVFAPVVTTLLYLVVFAHVLESRVQMYPGVSYRVFLVPGLVMMAILQNAFANSSSSLVQSKMTGNIVFVLLPPFSHVEFFCAYVFASMVRGLTVGVGVLIATSPLVELNVAHPLWALAFAICGSAVLGSLGVLAGIWAEKIDQLSAFQNFVVVPATFLSGVFYSINSLSPVWRDVSLANPFFFMIDGFRYSFFGQSDVAPTTSIVAVLAALFTLSAIALMLLHKGYRMRP
ncbi:MAG: metal-dependent hydrolase [Betaproteobacteria bacterium]|nr:metal-dependent hydrolase [Betaproteobacteria bacterium]